MAFKRKPLAVGKKIADGFADHDLTIEFRKIPYGYEARIGQCEWRTVIETDSGFILKPKKFEQPESGGGVSGMSFSPLVTSPMKYLRETIASLNRDLAREEYYSKKLEKLLFQAMSHD